MHNLKDSRQGWKHLYKLANKDNDSKKVALIRGYSWIEHALTAIGYSKNHGSIAQRLLIAKNNGIIESRLTEGMLRLAIKSRHAVAHADRIDPGVNCVKIMSIYEKIWESLKNNFVNITNAKKIANEIANKTGILSVSIYGSLSRVKVKPNDIDMLILDNGIYSDQIKDTLINYNDPVKRTLFCKNILNLQINEEIIKCRWLDISIINGIKLGVEKKYTDKIVSNQPDPYYFFNICEDLLDYNKINDEFNLSNISFFKELRQVKRDFYRILLQNPFNE